MQLLQQKQNNRKQHLIMNYQQSRNMLSTSILHMSSSVDENIDAKEIENNNDNNIQPDNSTREKIIQEKVELINELNDPIETQSTKLNELIEDDQSAVDDILNKVEIMNENDDDDDDIQIIIDDDDSNLILVINTTSSLSNKYTTNNTTSLLPSERSKRTRRKRKKKNPRMQMFAYLSQPSKFHIRVTTIYYYYGVVLFFYFCSY